MPKVGGGLTRKQELAIASLLTSGSLKQAAAVAGCTEVTLWRWLQQDAFKRSYREARGAAVEQAIALAQHLSLAVVRTFAEIMVDKKETVFARLSAGAHIKDMMLRGTELLDQQARIEELEALMHDDSAPKKKGLRVA